LPSERLRKCRSASLHAGGQFEQQRPGRWASRDGTADRAGIDLEDTLADDTVKAHVSRVMAKLGAGNRVQVAITARDAGLA
jgi:regulatory LuxR family protein